MGCPRPSRLGPVTHTLRTPPEASLPIATPPWPVVVVMPRMTTLRLGLPTAMPSSLRPDLMEMQSSLVANVLCSMSTFVDESGSIPSPLDMVDVVSMCTLRMMTSSEYSGCTVQYGEPVM